MLFDRKTISGLRSVSKIKRTILKNEPIMVEQKTEYFSLYFKFKSPTNGKTRYKKLSTYSYGTFSAAKLKNVKDEIINLQSKVIAGIDPIDESRKRNANIKLTDKQPRDRVVAR